MLFTVVTAFAVTTTALAIEPSETLITNDGSVYMGRTLIQDPSSKKITFEADSAIVVRPLEGGITLSPDEVAVEVLSDEWKNWFAANPTYVKIDNNGAKTVVMHRINPDPNNLGHVFLLEQSPTFYKYYFIANGTRFSILNNNIDVIKFAPRNPLLLSGIVEEIEALDSNGRRNKIKGQVVRQDNKYVGIMNDNGTTILVPNHEIIQRRVLAYNTGQSFFEQVKYLDKVEGNGTVTGYIVVRNYRPADNKEAYFTVRDTDGKDHNISIRNIKKVTRIGNKKYMPVRDAVITDDDQIVINSTNIPVINYDPYYDAETNLNGFVFDNNVKPAGIAIGHSDDIELHMRDNNENSTVTVIKISPRMLSDNAPELYYFFSYEDLLDDAIRPCKISKTKNGNKTIAYNLDPGTYIIYRNKDKKVYFFEIIG